MLSDYKAVTDEEKNAVVEVGGLHVVSICLVPPPSFEKKMTEHTQPSLEAAAKAMPPALFSDHPAGRARLKTLHAGTESCHPVASRVAYALLASSEIRRSPGPTISNEMQS